LEVIESQFRSVYTYSSLIRNSTDNDAELAAGFNFSVHKMALGAEIDEVFAELKVEQSAGLFAMKIMRLFFKFKDAHTNIYINPIYRTRVRPPLQVGVRLDEDSASMKFDVISSASWTSEDVVGKTISTVNGKPALDYYLEVASLRAIDKSPGAQLNRFLSSPQLYGIPPPADGEFNVTFEDNTSVDLKWMANMTENVCDLGNDFRICNKTEVLNGQCKNNSKVMEQCFSHNPDFEYIQAMMEKLGRKTLNCSEEGALLKPALSPVMDTQQDAKVVARTTTAELPEGLDDWVAADVADNETEEEAPPIEITANVTGSCEVLRVDLENGTVATILKIQEFGHFSDILPCAEAAVDQAAEFSDGNLIVDVISNGGGYISSGYDLNGYLYSNMQGSTFENTWDTCEWYDLPRNNQLDWLVSLSQKALPHFADASDPRLFILDLAARMNVSADALAEDPFFFGEVEKYHKLRNASTCLNVLVEKFGGRALRGGEGGENARRQFAALYQQCIDKAAPFGGDRGMEIMSYGWSNKYPEPLSQPSWDYYADTVTKIRGGEPRNFSSWTFLGSDCAAYASVYPKVFGATVLNEHDWPMTPQSKLKHITYLSDGLCGSTCSVSSTRPYVDGLATFVTFGGVKGEPMDITSFNGGNVETYQDGDESSYSLWKDALDSVVDAYTFFPDEKAPSWPFVPIPLNIYKARFAQRAEYLRALGPKALPREWYLIPASYHLDIWSSDVLSSYRDASSSGKQKLYEIYKETAALPPKPFVRTLI